MQEFARKENFESSIPEVPTESDKDEQKIKYTTDEGKEYRIYEMECVDCNTKFTRNIPDKWFDKGGDKIIGRNLPESLDLETAKKVFKNPQCGACQPDTKKKLDALKAKNEQLNN